MTSQKEVFQASEADEWFNRNRASCDSSPEHKSGLVRLLRNIELRPGKTLEIGCSNGFLLNQLSEEFGCECFGIDPSSAAIKDGTERFPRLSLQVGTADDLDFKPGTFDTIIFGFCLYLCDRKDLFKIAFEADRCLKNGGTIVITDFYPPFPYKNKYSHVEGIYSYKLEYGRMFTWNPAYSEVARIVYSHSGFSFRDVPDERVATLVLRKNEQFAYAASPLR